ncbi:MAG: phosphoribosyltransferase family protein [Syntrophales bacterium]|nr:phosphoribosyltransferase family protein [Syntrophales bacterium]MDD5643255.1 phosphoribosyltransferase family protein [Syntrophales bacterium]
MGKLLEDPKLRDRVYVFKDRAMAGRLLAQRLLDYRGQEVRVFAIPAGGVPVAAEIVKALEVPLDLVIVRKIQLPWTTEAGFGALNPAGEAIFNEDLLRRVHLSPEDIETQKKKTLATLKEREGQLRHNRPYPDLAGATTIIVDDGLASGYTMRAAINFLKGKGAGKIIVAVPTAAAQTAEDLLPLVDELLCLNLRGGWSFAVAEAYEDWYDLTTEEVMGIMQQL